jgi:quercetin dioxygenase-like cupin family protein
MTVVRGQLSIQLNEQDDHIYEAGNVLKIPEGTKMNVRNKHEATLELIVVKAPAPKS